MTAIRTEPTNTTRANTAVPRRKSRRWIRYAGAVLLIALIVLGLWPRPIPVEVAVVTTGLLRAAVEEEGKTRIKDRFVVSAPVSGQLRRIELKSGAPVVAGETVLALLDPLASTPLDPRARALALAGRDTATANVLKARDAAAFAKSELRRFEQLFANKAISDQEIESMRLRATTAESELAAATSALRQAEAELAAFAVQSTNTAPIEVRAPVNGRVLRVLEESARVVTAGMPLLELGDPANLEVVIEVLSRDGAGIKPGTPVELEHWGGGKPLQARVRLVEPAAFTKISALGVEEQRVNVIADLLTPPGERPGLGDQFRVDARIITWESPNALKLPSGALFRRGKDWAAFVVRGNRAELRTVKAGPTSGTETQVLEGLKEGESVILYPGDRVADGQNVRPITI